MDDKRAEALAFKEVAAKQGDATTAAILYGFRRGHPAALGLTEREWVKETFGGFMKIEVEERREIVKQLTASPEEGGEGLSTRKAADVLGVSRETIRRDSLDDTNVSGTATGRLGVAKQGDTNVSGTLVEQYPELRGLPPRDAQTVAAALDALPESERAEKRAALRRRDEDTLAELAGKPPMPKNLPPVQEMAANSPNGRWLEAIQELTITVSGITRNGGIATVARRWTAETRQAYLVEVRRLRATLEQWEATLEGVRD